MLSNTTVDQAQRIAPHIPRHVLVAYLTEMVRTVGVGRVVKPCGCLTSMASDYVRADSTRHCVTC